MTEEEKIEQEIQAQEAKAKKENVKNGKLFKKYTKKLLASIKAYFEEEKWNEITFDVEYLDGYFLFTFGKNSVVHFHTNVCPGWKFGIWWQKPEDTSNGKTSDCVKYQLFAQYEETIDKFKPSRSSLLIEDNIYYNRKYYKDDIDWASAHRASKLIKFIEDEPYLAFCRDYYMWNYNLEYHTREEAQERFENYCKDRDKRIACEDKANTLWLNFINTEVLPCFKGAKLIDRGECWSPRYEVVAPFHKNRALVEQAGLYYFPDFLELGFKDKMSKILEQCEEITADCLWSKPVGDFIYLTAREKKNVE